MGFSYLAERGTWWKGPTLSPSLIQSDLEVIGMPGGGVEFRVDDYANTVAGATALEIVNQEQAYGEGIIERITDVDYFKFDTPGGLVHLTANVAPLGPTLDLSLRLLDSAGNILDFQDTPSLGESINAIVPAGDYYVAVASHGAYGDVGQYTITGTIVPEPATYALAFIATLTWTLQRRADRAGSAVRNIFVD
jgi:hypothetical protein